MTDATVSYHLFSQSATPNKLLKVDILKGSLFKQMDIRTISPCFLSHHCHMLEPHVVNHFVVIRYS